MQQRRSRCRHLEPRSSPICRCRVLYLGSSVPHLAKDGLHGIQEPLRQLYPDEGVFDTHGIDSWLSVWSNGLLLENMNEQRQPVTRFFAIESLHYCAAVRCVTVPYSASHGDCSSPGNSGWTENITTASLRFLPLDSPFLKSTTFPSASSRSVNGYHPPLFAAILRRTSGIKVLECHAFVCKRAAPAHALVRCCFHAYADSMYARQVNSTLYAAIYCGVPLASQCGSSINGHSIEQAQIDIGDRYGSDGDSGGGGSHDEASADGTSVDLTPSAADLNHRIWQGDSGEGSRVGGWSSSTSFCGSRCSKKRQRKMPAAPEPPCTPTTITASCISSQSQSSQRGWLNLNCINNSKAKSTRTQRPTVSHAPASRLPRPLLAYSPQMMVLTKQKQQQQQSRRHKPSQANMMIGTSPAMNKAADRLSRHPQHLAYHATAGTPTCCQHSYSWYYGFPANVPSLNSNNHYLDRWSTPPYMQQQQQQVQQQQRAISSRPQRLATADSIISEQPLSRHVCHSSEVPHVQTTPVIYQQSTSARHASTSQKGRQSKQRHKETRKTTANELQVPYIRRIGASRF